MKTVLTYGTFDLFHIGHLRLLERLKRLGDCLIVGVSTDEFNALKNKKSAVSFSDRCEIVQSIRCVDHVIPEHSWAQKTADIMRLQVDIFGMGDDWLGRFDHLRSLCDVVYLPRTEGVSSTMIKHSISRFPVPNASSNMHVGMIN